MSELLSSVAVGADLPAASSLKFKADGTFKIVAFGDIHWNGNTAEDQKTLKAMESLIAWLEGDGISARLLVGPAGTGKTRLAFEFLRQVYVRFPEWKAGIVNHQDLRNHSKPFNDFVWNNPTLLVIDYAQPLANQLTLLFEALAFKKNGSFPPLRILLLERVAEPWFDPLLKTESSAAP